MTCKKGRQCLLSVDVRFDSETKTQFARKRVGLRHLVRHGGRRHAKHATLKLVVPQVAL